MLPPSPVHSLGGHIGDLRTSLWSDSGHLGLPDLVVSTVMDASNSHVDGRADKPSDSRLAVSLSYSYIRIRTVTQ